MYLKRLKFRAQTLRNTKERKKKKTEESAYEVKKKKKKFHKEFTVRVIFGLISRRAASCKYARSVGGEARRRAIHQSGRAGLGE